MTSARVLSSLAVLFGLSTPIACTFYTACPDNNQQPNTGGNNGTGGTPGTGGGDIGEGGALPDGEWHNETFNIVDLESECGNTPLMSANPNADMVIVSVARHGLWAKASDETEWRQLGQGDGSAVITNRGSSITYDPENPNTFWESGTYTTTGVFRTDDGGETFVEFPIGHNDSVSVDFTDPDRLTLLATGHEEGHRLYLSSDGGVSWGEIGDNLPADAGTCGQSLVIDASTFLLGCGSYGGGNVGIHRSTDGGESWTLVSEHASGGNPLVASDGTLYWMGEAKGGVIKSDDQGETWQGPFGEGELGFGTPVELPDGRLAALGQRRVLVSDDAGETWRVVTSAAPFEPAGVIYAVDRRAFYVWHWTCASQIAEDAVMAYDWDYETE
jgi:hypothetical protein